MDLVERIVPGDQLIDLEPAAQVELGEHRKIVLWPRRSVTTALDRPVKAERIHHELGAGVELRNADNGESPTGSQRGESLLHCSEMADRLKGVVDTASTGEILDDRDGIALAAVDRSVAPNWRAQSSFAGTRSTAMIRRAPASTPPWMMFNPIPPAPKTAIVRPASTRARFSTAPTPVMMPQPISAACGIGISFGILIALDSRTTVCSAKVEVLAKL